MRARLIPLDAGPPIELVKDLTLVGRNEDCDVRLDSRGVSKLHCMLVKTDGLVLVRDLGSTNGTRVNGQRVRRAALLPNDHLAIATFRYQVKLGDEADVSVAEIVPGPPAEPISLASDSDEHVPIPDRPGPPIKRNALPDVYPDTKPKR